MANPNASRLAQRPEQGLFQEVHDNKFATKTIAAAAIPSTTDFFTSAPSADPTLDNYDGAGILVNSLKKFSIHSIQVMIWNATASAKVSEIEQFLNNTVIVLVTALKEIGRFPLINLKSPGGIYMASNQLATTVVANPGSASTIGALNGTPDGSRLKLMRPVEVAENQSFKVVLLGPVTTAITLTAALQMRIQLEGIEYRPAA